MEATALSVVRGAVCGLDVERQAISPNAVLVTPKSCNTKLAPVQFFPGKTRPGMRAVPPFVAATSVSIAATCPSSCPFKGSPEKPGGCYAAVGITAFAVRRMDAAAAGLTADVVVAEEARQIDATFARGIPQDGARGGRDLRLHVAGDVGSEIGATMLAGAAARWRERGGGRVWTFTHRWGTVPRDAWGPDISVLASVETTADMERARAAGYAPAIVVQRHLRTGLRGAGPRLVPCPAETSGTTCVSCRLCLHADRLLERGITIAFRIHGPAKNIAAAVLASIGGGDDV